MKSLFLFVIFLGAVYGTIFLDTGPRVVPDEVNTNGTLYMTVFYSPDFFHNLERGIGQGTLAIARQNGVTKGFCITNTNSICWVNLAYGTYTLDAIPPFGFPLFRWVCTGSKTVDAPTVGSITRCTLRFFFFVPNLKKPVNSNGGVFPNSPIIVR